MSAKDMLDLVSFRNLHKLMLPVVVLSRVEQEERERKEEEERKKIEKEETKKKEEECKRKNPAETKKKEEECKRKNPAEAAEEPGAAVARPAGAASTGRVNMQLRSRLHHSFKPYKTVNQKKKKSLPRLLNDGMPTRSMMRKRKILSVADSDDLEDDKPLKYFARAVIARDAKRKRKFNHAKQTVVTALKSTRLRRELTSIKQTSNKKKETLFNGCAEVRAATRAESAAVPAADARRTAHRAEPVAVAASDARRTAHRNAHDAPRAKIRARSNASRVKPRDTIREAIRDTTRDTTLDITLDTTRDTTCDATRDATRDTTIDTTGDTTRNATDALPAKQRTMPRTPPAAPRESRNITRDPSHAPRAKLRTKTRSAPRAVPRHSARDSARAVAGEPSFRAPLFPSRRATAHPPAALDDANLCATERELASRGNQTYCQCNPDNSIDTRKAYDVYDFNNSDDEAITLRYGSPDSVGKCQFKRKASDHNGPDNLDLITEPVTHEFLEPSPIHASNRLPTTAARRAALGPNNMVSVFEGRLPSVDSMADESKQLVHTQIVTADIHTPPVYVQSPVRDIQLPAVETQTLLRDIQTPSFDDQLDIQTLGAESQPPAVEIQSPSVEARTHAVQTQTLPRDLQTPILDNQPSGPESQLPKREQCPTPKPANAEAQYLDIPFGNHIIEITNQPVGKKNKNIIRARLIPKSLNDQNENQFIEHEDLLNQLLNVRNEMNLAKRAPVERPVIVTGEVIVIPDDGVEESPVLPSTSSGAAGVANTSRGPSAPSRPTTRKKSSAAPPPPREMDHAGGDVVEAPVFHPTEAEFNDPLAYFEKIAITASKYGLCKVVAPPGFKPTCTLSDDIRFTVSNQYIARLYSRWGPASREMCAIKAYLASQSVIFSRAPLYEGIEVNLPKLYHIVQRNGGLKKVMEKKRWGRVAEEMHFTRGANPEKRVDQLYVKYLLPYDTLSNQERHDMMSTVERCWNKKNQKMLERAMNPLHRQKRLLGESDSSGDEDETAGNLASALSEAEDCVVSGRSMNLNTFRKVAANAMATLFPSTEQPTPDVVEKEYWRLVLLGTEHVCVNTASIDTGDEGYGFTKNKADPYGRHPWNLKMVSQNSGNVLRSLGPVLGVTVPTLHLGMVCSTSCWHRDPHGLPWVEYMHDGPPKIWYGIPGEQSENFRKAVETLCPTSCQNKSIWLPSDITMIPPNLLREHNVSMSRVVQRPGEFILVFPKAYSCSISTGFTQSESVYFATTSWLKTITQVFQEVRESCEPTMFSLEQLLLAVGRDPRAPLSVLVGVLGTLRAAVHEEAAARRALARAGVRAAALAHSATRHKRRPAGAWNVQDECAICRTTLFFSKVAGLTDKKCSVCLQHALRLLSAGRAANAGTLIINYLQSELEDAIEAAERRLNVMTSRSRPRPLSAASSTVAPY